MSILWDSWQKLIAWSHQTYSHLPWRSQRSLYTTLISELMLQQTTVAVVSQRWAGFMQQFPSLKELNAASQEEVLAAWQGLGYYARARNLYRLAQSYSSERELEKDLRSGIKQPGIGPYTRGALLSIGLNEPAQALDANIRRVLGRIFGPDFEGPYQELLQHYQPRCLNEALMDLGRTWCKARKADCEQCFFQQSCLMASTGIKVAPKPRQARETLTLIRLYCVNNGEILGTVKEPGQWLSGYLELPTLLLEGACDQYPKIQELHLLPQKPCWRFVSQITKYRLVNLVYHVSEQQARMILGEYESYCEFFQPSALWATAAHKTIKHFEPLGLDTFVV